MLVKVEIKNNYKSSEVWVNSEDLPIKPNEKKNIRASFNIPMFYPFIGQIVLSGAWQIEPNCLCIDRFEL